MAGGSSPAKTDDPVAVDGIFDFDSEPARGEARGQEASAARVDESFIRGILQSGIASAIHKKDGVHVGVKQDADGLMMP